MYENRPILDQGWMYGIDAPWVVQPFDKFESHGQFLGNIVIKLYGHVEEMRMECPESAPFLYSMLGNFIEMLAAPPKEYVEEINYLQEFYKLVAEQAQLHFLDTSSEDVADNARSENVPMTQVEAAERHVKSLRLGEAILKLVTNEKT